MKDTHVLCIACILALVAIASVFVGYTNDTLPRHTPRQITTAPPATIDPAQAATDTPAPKKKACSCCSEHTTAFQEEMNTYIKRKKAEAQEIAAK
ncbi:hypothetical protein F4054_15525 [Candidatus Poribacteria bacterium]|nr:hypothetical protein [Candidatus Poribacteria bacterium]MYG08721.1 hypothetical protein [Candidatus Poribacteria bacterium]MYK23652.1 hypothetical protein [Candidatus Poribacteria bacterium]